MAGAGYLLFTAGQVLTAAQVNTYLNQQSVMVFATTAARDAALTSVKSEGMVTYQLDNNDLDIYSGSAFSTLIAPASGALTTWVPVITQSSVVAGTASVATYQRIGRKVELWMVWTASGTGVGANIVTIGGLPFTGPPIGTNVGMGLLQDSSAAAQFSGHVQMQTTTTFSITALTSGTVNTVLGTTLFTAALAASDAIKLNVSYEAAADA